MQPGRHNTYVTLSQSPPQQSDDPIFKPLTPEGWWAAIEPLPPASAGDGTRLQAATVTMRYHPEVTIDTRLVADGTEWMVKGVQNVVNANSELVLYCEAVVP